MASPIDRAPGPPEPWPQGPAAPSERPPASSVRPPTSGTPVLLPDGWVATVTNKIVTTVDGVRAKTTTPIEKIGRVVIWGLLIATAGTALLVVLLAGVLRLLYEVTGRIPGISGREGRSVWMIDVLLGVLLIGLGLSFIKGSKPQPQD